MATPRAMLCIALSLWAPPLSAADPETVRLNIVASARAHLKSGDWAPGFNLRTLTTGYWCNLFVADVLREAGGATWDPIKDPVGVRPTRDPVAKEWADAQVALTGWIVVVPAPGTDNKTAKELLAMRRPGDVVSNGTHVGIVSDERGIAISASSQTGGVEKNDWSFRLPDASGFSSATAYEQAARKTVLTYTVRRFEGL